MAAGGRLLSLFKKNRWSKTQSAGWRAGFMPGERETALAIVQQRKGLPPFLKHCGIHPGIEVKPEHVLTALMQGSLLARASISGVVSADEYQLVQVEAPDVPAAELRAAVRWKLRDMINFAVDSAIVDVFEVPAPSRRSQTKMVFAVAARPDAVTQMVGLIAQRARGFDVIDIPELCLRNLSTSMPQDAKGVAFLALAESYAQLVITRQGVLYLTRRIELVRGMDLDLDGGTPPDIDAASLALELQRSLDYYESYYDQPPLTELVIAPAEARTRELAKALASETSLNIEVFEVERQFEVAPDIEIDTRWPGLIALGAALRSNSASS